MNVGQCAIPSLEPYYRWSVVSRDNFCSVFLEIPTFGQTIVSRFHSVFFSYLMDLYLHQFKKSQNHESIVEDVDVCLNLMGF